MAVTPNLKLPLLDSKEKVSEDHLKINQFVEALDLRLANVATTMAGLATAGHSHEMAKINGLETALELLAAKDHSHKLDELTDVEVEGAPDGKVLQKIAGKWGLGDRGYSASEINTIVAGLAEREHQHPVSDVTGLTVQLASLDKSLSEKASTAAVSQALSQKAAKNEALLLNKARVTDDGRFEINKGTVENPDWVEYRSGGIPVGHVSWCFFSRPLPGHIFLDNQIVSKEMYPELYEWALPDAVPEASRKAGQWAKIEGKEELRAPDTAGYFLRCLEAGREIGSVQGDAIRNITGSYVSQRSDGVAGGRGYVNPITEGAFTRGPSVAGGLATATEKSGNFLRFDASRVVPTAKENRPKNLAYKIQIKAFDVFDDPAQVKATALVMKVDDLTDRVAALQASQFGAGQKWHDVKAQRSIGTAYTNPTTRPVEVYVKGAASGSGNLQVSENGDNWIDIGLIGGSSLGQAIATIPPRHFYKVSNGTIETWAELR